jgi:hypothetical protein
MLDLFDNLRIAGPSAAHVRKVALDVFHALRSPVREE